VYVSFCTTVVQTHHRTVLIIFPLILQATDIAQTMSAVGEADTTYLNLAQTVIWSSSLFLYNQRLKFFIAKLQRISGKEPTEYRFLQARSPSCHPTISKSPKEEGRYDSCPKMKKWWAFSTVVIIIERACRMLAMDSRVASGLSNSETTPDPTYYNSKHTASVFGTSTIPQANLSVGCLHQHKGLLMQKFCMPFCSIL